jgi:hypothetical protein
MNIIIQKFLRVKENKVLIELVKSKKITALMKDKHMSDPRQEIIKEDQRADKLMEQIIKELQFKN